MRYLIMLSIIICLAIADYITGLIKAYCGNKLSSSKMRKGGLNKLSEIIIMAVSCWLDIGIEMLGNYYNSSILSVIASTVTASVVFVYIAIMEIISILENYSEINSEAKWTFRIIRKLKTFNENEEDE